MESKMIAGSLREIIRIPAKTVEMETGELVKVKPFLADRNCVTLEMFLNFQKETGYVTSIGHMDRDSHVLNSVNELMSKEERLKCPVQSLSPKDAFEFCDWAGGRLLTEEEWMAASILDQRIIDPRSPEYEELWDSDRRLKLASDPLALELIQEFTSTPAPGNCIIVRYGPMYYRGPDWKRHAAYHRIPRRMNEPDLISGFRVCYTEIPEGFRVI